MNSGSLKSLVKAHRTFLVCLLLTLATVSVYWQVRTFDFTNYDDFFMVVHNPMVASGLTPHGMLWALSTSWFEYWHPLTWLSHMLDCELFGLAPGYHHLVSLGFHAANTLLLFIVLRRMTGALWRSAMVAALFALHPLHVESVAWVAERKDVLSTFFFMLTLWAYCRYVEQSKVQSPKSRAWYGLALGMYGCGLMSKPMLVTLPFVLLLLDHWPLGRVGRVFECPARSPSGNWKPWYLLVKEKLPFFALTLVSCVVTYLGVRAGRNIISAEEIPWSLRLANVPVSYVRYLGKMIWPANLTALYPIPTHWSPSQVEGALLILLLISVIVVVRASRAPYLVVGWLLFLGMLVPVIGVVASGFQSIADRYTYVPYIGLFVAVVWATADLSARRRFRTVLLGGTAALVLLVCAALTWGQVGCWRSNFTLWPHCLMVDPDNAVAHYNLGYALQNAGQTREAMEHYRAALRKKPDYVDANLNLGAILSLNGQLREATNYFAKALSLKPDYATAHADMGYSLRELGDYAGAVAECAAAIRLAPNAFGAFVDAGRASSAQGKSDDALRYYAGALRLNPAFPQTRYCLGLEWLKRGDFAEAASSFGEAVRLAPAWPDAHFQLAVALAGKGAIGEAIGQYREALRLKPESSGALNNLAWILATRPEAEFRNGVEAVRLAERACRLTDYKAPALVGTLAAAYAEAGRFEEAVATAKEAYGLALAGGQKNVAGELQRFIELFAARQPFRDTLGGVSPN